MKKICCVLGLTLLPTLSFLSGNAGATVIYSNDFDSAATVASGVTATLTGGSLGTATGSYSGNNGKTWSGHYFNGASQTNSADPLISSATLTLTGLTAHTGVSIDLLLGFLNSWDSRNGSVSPDNLNISIDGSLLLNMTTNNATGTIVDFDGGTLVVDNGQIESNSFYSDDLVDMATASALNFAHTASTLTITITPFGDGWQGWTDEGWGMDALSVSLTGTSAVPEPSTMLLFGTGIAGLAGIRRRMK